MSYDPKCEELARLFLADSGDGSAAFIDAHAARLAQRIQDAIESELEDIDAETPTTIPQVWPR